MGLKSSKYLASVFLGLALICQAAFAGGGEPQPVQFDFVFEENGGPARAEGYVVFDTAILDNPSDGDRVYDIENPILIDLGITVSGATVGNGEYFKQDFQGVIWDTTSSALNLFEELVGQTTDGDPWGTPSGGGGNFVLYSSLAI